jgi:hypothetical protein
VFSLPYSELRASLEQRNFIGLVQKFHRNKFNFIGNRGEKSSIRKEALKGSAPSKEN